MQKRFRRVFIVVLLGSLFLSEVSGQVVYREQEADPKSKWVILGKSVRSLLGRTIKETESIFGEEGFQTYKSDYWFGPKKLVSTSYALEPGLVLDIDYRNGYVCGFSVRRSSGHF